MTKVQLIEFKKLDKLYIQIKQKKELILAMDGWKKTFLNDFEIWEKKIGRKTYSVSLNIAIMLMRRGINAI